MSGTPLETIARIVSIDVKTLKKHYADDLELSTAQANAQVAQALFKTAIDRDAGMKHVTAAMFWLECRAGWRRRDDHGKATGDSVTDAATQTPTLQLEFVGPEGGPEEGTGFQDPDAIAASLAIEPEAEPETP